MIMRPLADHVYYEGWFQKKLTLFAVYAIHI